MAKRFFLVEMTAAATAGIFVAFARSAMQRGASVLMTEKPREQGEARAWTIKTDRLRGFSLTVDVVQVGPHLLVSCEHDGSAAAMVEDLALRLDHVEPLSDLDIGFDVPFRVVRGARSMICYPVWAGSSDNDDETDEDADEDDVHKRITIIPTGDEPIVLPGVRFDRAFAPLCASA